MTADSKGGISFGEGISPEIRKSDFAMITIPARERRILGFRLALPRDWKEVPEKPADSGGEISVAATFAASNDVSITVLQTRVPYEINLNDWLEYQCHLRRFRIEALQTGHAQNGTEVHAVARTSSGDFLRMAIAGDGDKLLWLVGRSIARIAVEYEDILGLAAASIRILSHSGTDTREELKRYKEAGGFEILYPASWQPERVTRYLPSRAAADFRLLENNQTLAYVRAESDVSTPEGKPGLNAVLRRALADMEDAGVKLHPLQPVPLENVQENRWVGECDLPAGPGQIAVLIRRAASSWQTAVLLSPAKTVNPWVWMRGKRFFEIAVVSLTPSR